MMGHQQRVRETIGNKGKTSNEHIKFGGNTNNNNDNKNNNQTAACVPSSGCHFGTQATTHRKWARVARIVLLAPPASACKICIPFSPRTLPPAKSAFLSRLARFRLLNLRFLSVCLASAC